MSLILMENQINMRVKLDKAINFILIIFLMYKYLTNCHYIVKISFFNLEYIIKASNNQ